MRKGKLGKGLDSLIGGTAIKPGPDSIRGEQVREILISKIKPNPHQPRRHFNTDEIESLAASIRFNGLLQPISIKENEDGSYSLIAGERRLRAFQKLGRERIPAIIKIETQNQQMLELALIENIQREDLNPVERALAYQALIAEFELTQEEAAKRLGKSRAGLANTLRLLSLPNDVQDLIAVAKLSEGHAKVLLQSSDARHIRRIAQQCIAEGWSVRRLEEEMAAPPRKAVRLKVGGSRDGEDLSAYLREIQDKLTVALSTRVRIKVSKANRYKGSIVIEFHHNDDFENAVNKILQE